jgi:protein ImuA
MSNRTQTLEKLRNRVRELETDSHSLGDVVSTGCDEFDRLFSKGGLERGSLVEWIGSAGSGATTVALKTAQAVCDNRVLVVLDSCGQFYPTAADSLGIALDRTIVVQPNHTRDYQWTLLQILRSGGIAAVVCWPDKANEKMLRRWQLAAEHGKTMGFLIRPPMALQEPTWAQVRLLVEAQYSHAKTRRWKMTILGSLRNDSIEVEMDDETGRLQKACSLPVASALVDPTPLQRSTGA